MQIQRIQTLMLLIAAILVGIFCFTPFASMVDDSAAQSATLVAAKDVPALLVLNLVIAALLIINIFMYKKLRQQKRMTIMSVVLICASIVTSGFIIFGKLENATPVLFGGVVLLIAALVFALLAYRGMSKDHETLRSMDRLR